MNYIAVGEDLLACWAETNIIGSAHSARAIPIFTDANWNVIRLNLRAKTDKVVDEIATVISVANGLSTEFDAVYHVWCNISICAGAKHAED